MSHSFFTTAVSGSDGLVHLDVPAESNQSYNVFVQLVARPAGSEEVERDERGWPIGVFETTAGRWRSDFPQDYEGDFEKRLEF